MRRLQQRHGGVTAETLGLRGKPGNVAFVDKRGSVRVFVDDRLHALSPFMVELV